MSNTSPSSDALVISRTAIRRVVSSIVLVAALVAVAFGIAAAAKGLGAPDSLATAINKSEFQAVFLTNGQVYFGKLTAPGSDFYYLRDVYYLASQGSLQNGHSPRPTLIKLGNEIHGPEDLMIISRTQVLFIENLKRSGQVSRAILHSGGS